METINAFCRAHHKDLVNFAFKLGEVHGEAEDAVQDVWAKLFRSGRIHSLVGEATPHAYLITALRRTIINRRMRGKRVKRGGAEPVSLDFEEMAEPGHNVTPERLLEFKEFSKAAEAIGVEAYDGKAPNKKEGYRRYRLRRKWRKQLAEFIS